MGAELLFAAGSKKPDGYDFYLDGDLGQMGEQHYSLSQAGFDVRQSDVYPVLKSEDKDRAIRHIWDNRVPGWWHYKKYMLEKEICTEEEFMRALDASIAARKRDGNGF